MLNTKNTPKSVNKSSKSLLAKCMATEDIRVEHSGSAETASFDIKDRCLTLPIWKNMSNSMYDMLVAHEVSHALNTPFQEWEDARKTVKNQGAFMQVANVVEDARIERMIKAQYPGIRKDFARAYSELHTTDLFALNGKNLADLNLIDRLNIEFKLGLFGLVQVPFSAEEQKIVKRMANTVTFAQVIELAKELLTDWESEQDEQQPQNGENGEGSESDSGCGDFEKGSSGDDQDGDDAESQSGSGGDDQDGDDQDSSTGQESPMETSNIDDINGSSDKDNENGDDSNESNESGDTDARYEYDDYTNNSGAMPSETQQAFEQGKKALSDPDAHNREYFTIPTSMNLDNIIIDSNTINSIWESFESTIRRLDESTNSDKFSYYANSRTESAAECDKFLTSKKAVINHMVSQFQMKQSADADRRTSIAKTGVLDTTAMMSYKWNEEIFANNEVISDGKNHGMVFFLDWSGSMGSIIKDTLEQLFILTEFCNKVNIPFEVYAFSDRDDLQPNNGASTDDDGVYIHPQYNVKEGATNQIRPHTFSLINFISSLMNKQDYKTAVRRLYHLATSRYGNSPQKLSMGCTPLNEAIVASFDIIPKFQRENGVQIVNAVFLTDGQGHGMGCRSGYYTDAYVHDPVTKKDYHVTGDETDLYLKILKDRTACNTVGIYLTTAKKITQNRYRYLNDNDISSATATWKQSNYAVASDNMTGYDECYIIKANIGGDDDALDNLDADASYSRIKNAFAKSANNTKTNKIIATKMVEVFASTLVN